MGTQKKTYAELLQALTDASIAWRFRSPTIAPEEEAKLERAYREAERAIEDYNNE